MMYLLIHHKVRDYAAWKPVFDAHAATRAKEGCKGGRLFRSSLDQNDVTILFEWDSLSNAEKFIASTDLRNVMREAGVIGDPQILFLDAVETLVH